MVKGEGLSPTDHQADSSPGTCALVTSSRGPGCKQSYYLPARMLSFSRYSAAAANSSLDDASLAQTCPLRLLPHLHPHLLAPSPVSQFNSLPGKAPSASGLFVTRCKKPIVILHFSASGPWYADPFVYVVDVKLPLLLSAASAGPILT